MPGPFAKISKCLPRPGDFWWAFIVILPFLDTRKWLSASPFSVDSWAGVDKTVPFKLRVSETTRAEREGRAGKSKGQVSGDEVAAEDREAEEGEDDDEDDEEGAAYCSLPLITPKLADLLCSPLCSVKQLPGSSWGLASAHAAMRHACMQPCCSCACVDWKVRSSSVSLVA